MTSQEASKYSAKKYSLDGLLEWVANIDIQPVFSYCSTVACMYTNLSKTEHECSKDMRQAKKNALE